VSLVERMASARASADREMYQRQTARPVLLGVDALVYELNGLTEEEIKIVEAA